MERLVDLVQLLPDDVLADILRHLAPRSLAASRCVCKVWRAVIDTRCLLRADILPLSLGGIFTNILGQCYSHFVSRPLTGRTSNGDFDNYYVRDHCNGLLLLLDAVANPATRQWAPLPEPPRPRKYFVENQYLVFDPTESLHYEVVSVPHVRPPVYSLTKSNSRIKKSEWPPSPCIMHVFSSRTGQWDKRFFVRQGNAAGTIADMILDQGFDMEHYAVYWRGALYVHCQTDFVMRISLSNNTYQVIKPPTVSEVLEISHIILGRSKKGVYWALLDRQYRLCTWYLNESCGQTEWVLKHDKILKPFLPHMNYGEKTKGPWILHINAYEDDDNESTMEKKFEWDSDNDDIVDAEDRAGDCDRGYVSIIGFHPYKEVVFLDRSGRGLAYHLNSSKLQYLGKLYPDSYEMITTYFTYTPCWIGEFPDAN